jgi:UrcA family protein
MIRIIAASALALVSIASLSVPASAETIKVGYTDLDLSNAAGQKTLRDRVAVAITLVCGTADSRDLAAMSQVNACRKAAAMDTARQVASVVDPSKRLAARNTVLEVASR